MENPRAVILEIRAGAGGNEAGLFVAELFRMYKRFSQIMGWNFSELGKREGGIGELHEITAEIKEKTPSTDAMLSPYSLLKNESGVQRVQRIPKTEKSGRIHTSTVTVAVLPLVSTREVEIKPQDVKVEFYRSSSQGGQNVQKVSTAVRLTHTPTGVVVTCQEERSQFQNRERAMSILSSRLFEMMRKQQKTRVDDLRREQIGTGDRSEKIKTYNFPQDRLTDHRIGKSFHHLEGILDGNLLPVLKASQ